MIRIRQQAGRAFYLLSAAMIAVSGCTPHQPAPPPAASTATISMPTINTLPGTNESQSKGGLTISVAPATYSQQMVKTVSLVQSRATFNDVMVGPPGRPLVHVVKTTRSQPLVTPNYLKFLVTINNQMPRVFHGAGTVVQFNIGGHLLPIDQAAYAPLQAAIVPPQSQAQIEIFGPPLDKLPPGQNNLGLFFYDVVTAQDAAGNVTEKQNYHWDFSFAMTPQQVEVSAPTEEHEKMSAQEFQAEIAELRKQPGGLIGDPGTAVPMQ